MQHVIADYPSRLELGEAGTTIIDDFPDAQLFRVETVQSQDMNEDMEDSWIIEMTIFITTGLPPQQLSTNERKRLAVRSRNFCIINNTLYHKRVDGIWRRVVRQFEKSVIL